MTDEELATAANVYFETLDRFPGWKGKIIGAFAAGALGLSYEPPARYPATGLDDNLNWVTATAHLAGEEFRKKYPNQT